MRLLLREDPEYYYSGERRSADYPVDDNAAAELVRAFEGLDGFPIIFSNGEALYRPELLDDPQHFGMDAYVENFKSHCTAVPDMEQRFLAAPYPVEKLDFYFVDSAERAKYLARVQDVRAWVVPCESARSTPSASIRGAVCRHCAAA